MKLGELEKKVMEYAWARCASNDFVVRDIVDGLSTHHNQSYAYNTILTVITHLFDKGLLKRTEQGKTFSYSIRLSKEQFVARASRAVFNEMKKEYGTLAIAHFAQMIDEIDPKLLAAAEKELNTR